MNTPEITEFDLHAYLDGQLSEARCAAVEAYLAAHPEEAARLEAYAAQDQALRQHFAPMLDEAIPEAMNRVFETAAVDHEKSRILPRWSLMRVAAGFMIALLGGGIGWFGHGWYQPAERLARGLSFPQQAAVAHAVFSPDVRRPVEVGAEQEEQLVKWLSKRLGTAVNPPKLGGLGYELMGGRLLPGNSGPVAQFMYQDAAGQRLTLYVSTEVAKAGDTGFRFAREGQVNVFYWVDGKFGYALSGRIDKPELAKLATAVYDSLIPR